MKRPKEMSVEEIRALPVGPHVRRVHEHTAEDMARGYVDVGGKRRPCRGRRTEWLESRKVLVCCHEPDDLFVWQDPGSEDCWSFGQWAEGRWFKTPALL